MRSSKRQTFKTDDPYTILGLDRNADASQIKRAYFRLVREFPPESEPEKFQQIRAAYDQLRTPERRSHADLFLLQPPPEKPDYSKVDYDLSVHQDDLVALAIEIGLAQVKLQTDFKEPILLK
jgi:curved DNA-binding protein CbpA